MISTIMYTPRLAISRENLNSWFEIGNHSNLFTKLPVLEGAGKCELYSPQIVNNKGADQTARMRNMICAFVIR